MKKDYNLRKRRERFLQKLRERDLHDVIYDGKDFKSVNTKIKVKCKIHGEFMILPSNLLNEKIPCRKCYIEFLKKERALNTKSFVEQLKKLYGDSIDYSNVNYKHNKIPVNLICLEKDKDGNVHGEYKAKPCNLTRGFRGCEKCQNEKDTAEQKKREKLFIENALKIYDIPKDTFNNVKYVNNREKVIITCLEHGNYRISPADYLSGRRCSKCNGNYRYKTDEWIELARKVHGNKYDYSKTEYVNWKTKICIICPKHGEFWQTPNKHYNAKQGCPFCANENNKWKLEEIVKKELITNNIGFVPQKRFDWLPNFLSLDFYLPEYNIAIECQGEQHFKPVNFGGGVENAKIRFQKQQENDMLKKELCNMNNIRILYFSNLKINYPYQVFINEKELIKNIIQH